MTFSATPALVSAIEKAIAERDFPVRWVIGTTTIPARFWLAFSPEN